LDARRCAGGYIHLVQIHAGTSGWSYAAWRGRFYPPGLPTSRMLPVYADHFDAVEVNSTYYRMPRPATLAAWRAQVPEAFRFALKAPLWMMGRRSNAAGAMRTFDDAAAALGPALGPTLFRAAPGAPDVGWLREFLALVPRGRRAVLELRDPAWFREDAMRVLRDAGAALCTADADEGETPLVPTAPFGYLRLRRADYSADALRRWAARILAQPWTEAFVFFRHEDEARGPRLARAFLEAWADGAARARAE